MKSTYPDEEKITMTEFNEMFDKFLLLSRAGLIPKDVFLKKMEEIYDDMVDDEK